MAPGAVVYGYKWWWTRCGGLQSRLYSVNCKMINTVILLRIFCNYILAPQISCGKSSMGFTRDNQINRYRHLCWSTVHCLGDNNRIRNSGNIQLLCFARFNQIVRPFSVFPSIYSRFCSLPSILLIGCFYFASWQTTSTFYCYWIVLWWMNYY